MLKKLTYFVNHFYVMNVTILYSKLLACMVYCRTWKYYLCSWYPYQISGKSVRVRVTLRLAVYCQSVPLIDKPLEITTSNFIFQLNTCGYSPYVTSSLRRGWVYRLQLLLALASAVILTSEARGTHDQVVSDSRLPQPGKPGSRIYVPQW
jgi:hypothetical protein